MKKEKIENKIEKLLDEAENLSKFNGLDIKKISKSVVERIEKLEKDFFQLEKIGNRYGYENIYNYSESYRYFHNIQFEINIKTACFFQIEYGVHETQYSNNNIVFEEFNENSKILLLEFCEKNNYQFNDNCEYNEILE